MVMAIFLATSEELKLPPKPIASIVCISLIDKSENSLILSEVSSINRISLKIETKNSFISKMVEWSTHYHPFNLFWTSNYLIIKVYRKSAHLSTHVLGPDRLYGALSLINQAWSRLQVFLSSSCCLGERKWLKSPYLGAGPGLRACDLQLAIKARGKRWFWGS